MGICPKCGEEIEYLIYNAYELQKAYFDGVDYTNWDSLGVTKGNPEYLCPECLEQLFTNEEKAVRFLRGSENG